VIQLAHRLVLTENCNMSCPHCFNANVRHGGVMDTEKILHFFHKNSNYVSSSVLKIMGGEPTLHPDFLRILVEGCKYYGKVMVFTNGSGLEEIVSNPFLVKQHMQNKLTYAINGYTFDIENFNAYSQLINYVILHFVILKNYKRVVEKIMKCVDFSHQIHFMISPDTQVDLFDNTKLEDYRKIWISAITEIIPEFKRRNIGYSYDHVLPICFYTQEMIDELHRFSIDDLHASKITCCGDQFMGLIDYNFDLYYCNQTRIKLGSILNENGQPKTLPEIEEMIQRGSKIKSDSIKDISEKCSRCPVVAACKVGCYYNSLVKHYG